ncbi:hypothetical protein [Tolypothrix sp. VBCCA 56010]|uniref:hypothetical protein n=1 Tax=Tolypothrix sp. VBCCA 56010 TaxID=3137731 RepID=UPI003D7D69CB
MGGQGGRGQGRQGKQGKQGEQGERNFTQCPMPHAPCPMPNSLLFVFCKDKAI